MVSVLPLLSGDGKNGFNGKKSPLSQTLISNLIIPPSFKDENLECKDYWKGIRSELPLKEIS